jgi:phage terminase small subunit
MEELYKQAEKDYLNGMKYKEIAEKYGVSINTVKSWKQRYKWNRKSVHTEEKCVHTKKDAPKQSNNDKKETFEVSEELTEKQRLFCVYYVKTFNATQSAIKANYAPDSAHVEGSRLLRNAKVATEIKRLKEELTGDLFLEAMDVLKVYVKIAFADITDYISFGQREEQAIGMYGPVYEGKGEDKKPVMETVNYIDLKGSSVVDGTIITEVKQGKEGVSVKLADKMKALEKLEKYFDLFPDNFKREIEREKLKLAQRKVNGDDEEEYEDDGFLDALNATTSEVWTSESTEEED